MALKDADAAILAHFRNLLVARTQPDGKPKPGFGANVALLKREIAKLEAKDAAA